MDNVIMPIGSRSLLRGHLSSFYPPPTHTSSPTLRHTTLVRGQWRDELPLAFPIPIRYKLSNTTHDYIPLDDERSKA